jgi:hypothetical protein
LARLQDAAASELAAALATRDSEAEKLRGSCSYYQGLLSTAQAEADGLRSRADELERQLAEARAAAEAVSTPVGGQRGTPRHSQRLGTPRQSQLHAQQGHNPFAQHGGPAAAPDAGAAQLEERAGALQARCAALEEQVGRLREELASVRATSEAMLEAKDSDLLAALRKNAALSEELSAARQAAASQQRQQQQQQQEQRAAATAAAVAAARQDGWGTGDGGEDAGDVWVDAASAGFVRRGSVGGSSAGFGGNGLLSPRGRPQSLGLPGSLQLLGSAAPSEPGGWGPGTATGHSLPFRRGRLSASQPARSCSHNHNQPPHFASPFPRPYYQFQSGSWTPLSPCPS